MRFEIGVDGALLLTGISDAAKDFLWTLKREAWHEFNRYGDQLWVNWFFTSQKDGSVTVKLSEQEYAGELVKIMEELAGRFDLDVTLAANEVLKSWQTMSELQKKAVLDEEELQRKIAEFNRKASGLKLRVQAGCKRCEHFHECRLGDDTEGYCFANAGNPVRLAESALSFRYGENMGGVQYMGTKYFPHENCEYLKEIRI